MKEKEVLVLAQIGRKQLLILLGLVVEATEVVEVEGDMEVTQTVPVSNSPKTCSYDGILNEEIFSPGISHSYERTGAKIGQAAKMRRVEEENPTESQQFRVSGGSTYYSTSSSEHERRYGSHSSIKRDFANINNLVVYIE
ncbi:unnamed protein product [Hymenolepis diminuta]|uniref:Uncharacterized protein n=1 Tax=Hymenolepis diminuta TaxID=6216 RepID=A0A564Y0R0_HYMDI|nr:unnamed protein product [Hymenolepis diminuta]